MKTYIFVISKVQGTDGVKEVGSWGGVNIEVDIDAKNIEEAERQFNKIYPDTIRSCQQKLGQFKDLIFEVEPNILPKDIRLEHIKDHIIIRLLDEGRSEVTVNTLLRAVRTFFNFLHDEGYININPVERLKLLKENQKIVPTLPHLRWYAGM